MTNFLLWVIAILVAVIGWGGRQALVWAKESWKSHVQDEDKYRDLVSEEIKTIKAGIEMFFQEIPPLKDAMNKIPDIEKKVGHIEKDVTFIKSKFKIK